MICIYEILLTVYDYFIYHCNLTGNFSCGNYISSVAVAIKLQTSNPLGNLRIDSMEEAKQNCISNARKTKMITVMYRMFPFIICLILMNYLMEFYFIGFVNAHLPGCFCPWKFRLNIGLNTSPSDSFVSYLNSHLGYSAGEFQALQLIVLAVFGAVD